MIKSMFGALALFIFLLAPVSGQVDVAVGDKATDQQVVMLTYWVDRFGALVGSFDELLASGSCGIDSLFGDNIALACVTRSPEENKFDLLAAAQGFRSHTIGLFRDMELVDWIFDTSGNVTSLIVFDLDPGVYEVVAIGYGDDSVDTATFEFSIEGSNGGD